MTLFDDMTRAVSAVPIWVGLLDESDVEPVDGYSRVPVGDWAITGNVAEAEVTFIAGRGWGTLATLFLADKDGGIWRRIAVPEVTPRPGDTIVADVWFEVDG